MNNVFKVIWKPRVEDSKLTVRIFDTNTTGFSKSSRETIHGVDGVQDYGDSFTICYKNEDPRLSGLVAKRVFAKPLFTFAIECDTGVYRESVAI